MGVCGWVGVCGWAGVCGVGGRVRVGGHVRGVWSQGKRPFKAVYTIPLRLI